MKRPVLLLSFLLLSSSLPAQAGLPAGEKTPPPGRTAPEPPRKVKAPRKGARFAGIFFRAFYLQYGEKRVKPAEKLYREYLDKAGPSGRFAWRAAKELAGILEKRGEEDQAKEILKRYPRPDQARRTGRRRRLQVGEKAPNRDAWIARAGKQLAAMKARLKKLQESGAGDQQVEALTRRIERMSKVLEKVKDGSMSPPRWWGRRGARRKGFQLSKMDPDRREALLERILEKARKRAERLEQKGDEERSRALLKKCSQLEELVQQGKWDEVSRILSSLRPERRGNSGSRNRGRMGRKGIPRGEKRKGPRKKGTGRQGFFGGGPF